MKHQGIKFLCAILIFMFWACNQPKFSYGGLEMKLTSPAFEHNQMIPQKYTCQGEDINPPLIIEGIPEGVKSLVLIVDDPDAPMGTWDHWIVYNIEPISEIQENTVPSGGIQAMNSFRKIEYGGPCPPSGTHRYFFKLYAMDKMFPFNKSPNKYTLAELIEEHSLAKAELVGLYKKKK